MTEPLTESPLVLARPQCLSNQPRELGRHPPPPQNGLPVDARRIGRLAQRVAGRKHSQDEIHAPIQIHAPETTPNRRSRPSRIAGRGGNATRGRWLASPQKARTRHGGNHRHAHPWITYPAQTGASGIVRLAGMIEHDRQAAQKF